MIRALAVIEAVADAVLVVRASKVVFANAAASRLVGREIVEGEPLEGLLAPNEMTRIERQLGSMVHGASRTTFRVSFEQASGEVVVTDLALHRDGDGEEILLCARDAADSTRAEELIGELATLLADGNVAMNVDALLDASAPIFRALGWSVMLSEVDGGHVRLGRLIAASHDRNQALLALAERLKAAGPVESDRMPMHRRVLEEGRPIYADEAVREIDRSSREGMAFAESLAGSEALRGAWVPIRTNAGWSHVLTVMGHDLTEHDFVAVQLFAAQIAAAVRLERLGTALVRRERLAAVGEMAAVLAHEVRNPLGVVFNVAGGLKRMVGEDADALARLARMEDEAEHLKRLVSELLDFARPSVPELRPIAVGPLVTEALEMAKGTGAGEGKAVDLSVEVDETLPDAVADPLMLRDALAQMLQNALEHVPDGGRVSVGAEAVGSSIRILVSNDGPPVGLDVAPRIFEPFFTTSATGSGLGLSVVRRAVEDMGGRVELLGPDRGVSFALWLPSAEAVGKGDS